MVYFHTSKNVKLIRSLMQDYRTLNETSPHEYMKTYFDSCPQNVDDSKTYWIIESFLGIQKHSQFFNQISIQLTEELSEEDKDHFTIIFHAIIFQTSPKDMMSLYKCMFNLSKVLLSKFVKLLSNIENLPLILKIAEAEYDKTFVTESIKTPLYFWQPFICEMNQIYMEYLHTIETRKLKMPTIPMDMNVLNRTAKIKQQEMTQKLEEDSCSDFLPDKRSKMLTDSKIRKNLNRIHEKNKLKALNLYTVVKNNKRHHTLGKSTRNNNHIKEENIKVMQKKPIPSMTIFNASPEIKTTLATVKRISEKIKEFEEEEIKWLRDIIDGAGDVSKIEELIKYDREEKKKESMLEIERKHLIGQISFEEAVIAKKKLIQENKRKCEEFLKEKKNWEKEIEEWKLKEIANNRKQVEKLSLLELEVINARSNMTLKRKEMAQKLRQDSKDIKQNAMKNKQAELEHKVNMIKEIKMLTMIAQKSKIPKIIDLTESSGLGFLCEMSIAELQERKAAMKICLKEELEEKRNKIKTLNLERKQELEETKKSINDYMTEKAKLRKETKTRIVKDILPTNEINQLKNLLLEKRNQRMMLTK